MSQIPILREPSQITAAWLSQVLGADVASFTRRPVSEGVGMLGILELIDLTYAGDAAGKPASVAVKFPTTNEMNRAVAVSFNVYAREVLFYRQLATLTPARSPRIYFSDIEGDSDFVIVMEDFTGYRLGDQVIGCTAAEARLGVIEMAKLHASFWGKVDQPEFDFVPYHFPGMHSEGMHQGCIAGWDQMLDIFADSVPAWLSDIRHRYNDAVPALQEWLVDHPRTLVHGDFRMDNLFFGVEPGHAPLVLIDWQGTLRAKGVQDLAYLLSQSVDADVRRANERDLVKLYHQSLVDGGVTGYSLEQVWDDYRKAVLYLWVYVTVIAGTLDPTNERGRAWMGKMIRRSAAAIDELGTLEFLP